MDDIRKVIKNSPPAVVLQTLRSALAMPSAPAKAIINELTRPLHDQPNFIKKINNTIWKGALIMPDMINCDEEMAIQRMKNADIVIFEVHGGGFRVGSSTMYMDSFINWLDLFKTKHNLNACIMSVDYGLSPKYKYPVPVHQCMKAFDYLTKILCVPPTKIILSGDSAGGALCLETLIRTYAPNIIHDLDAPRENFDMDIPAGLLLSSPLVSGETDSGSWKKFEKSDMVSMALADMIFQEFLGLPETKPEDLPILQLGTIKEKFSRFCPKNALVFVGSKEVMRDHVVELASAVDKDGSVNISLITEDYPHDWFMIHEVIPQRRKHIINYYDELFVDFAVDAVQEVTNQSPFSSSSPPSAITGNKLTQEEQNQVSITTNTPTIIDVTIVNTEKAVVSVKEEDNVDMKSANKTIILDNSSEITKTPSNTSNQSDKDGNDSS